MSGTITQREAGRSSSESRSMLLCLVKGPGWDFNGLGSRVWEWRSGWGCGQDREGPLGVFQVTGPGLAEGFGPLRSLDDPALRHNLPAQATSFVGRAAELAELRFLAGRVAVGDDRGAGRDRQVPSGV